MRLAFYLSLILFALFIYSDEAFSLQDYQIERLCKKKKKVSICIKNLKEKRSNLIKGNIIEIPVIPYKR